MKIAPVAISTSEKVQRGLREVRKRPWRIGSSTRTLVAHASSTVTAISATRVGQRSS